MSLDDLAMASLALRMPVSSSAKVKTSSQIVFSSASLPIEILLLVTCFEPVTLMVIFLPTIFASIEPPPGKVTFLACASIRLVIVFTVPSNAARSPVLKLASPLVINAPDKETNVSKAVVYALVAAFTEPTRPSTTLIAEITLGALTAELSIANLPAKLASSKSLTLSSRSRSDSFSSRYFFIFLADAFRRSAASKILTKKSLTAFHTFSTNFRTAAQAFLICSPMPSRAKRVELKRSPF